MASINQPVGRNATNNTADVKIIQELLNQNHHLLLPLAQVPENGAIDAATLTAIETFQSRVVVTLDTPDGRIDPGGQTLAKLNANAKVGRAIPDFIFPLRQPPLASFRTGGRFFGAGRTATRAHGGCDLLQNVGSDILAMEDGVVIEGPYLFLDSTSAIEVDHGGFVVRYCEISAPAPGVRVGTRVNKGDVIAFVGQLDSGASMLHLEMYSGTQSGGLTDGSNLPFQRRSDLINPSDYLDNAPLANGLNPGIRGRVSLAVASGLNLRSDPATSATVLRSLGAGTMVKILQQVDGSPYSPGNRTDWYEIQVDGQRGFVAALFIERL